MKIQMEKCWSVGALYVVQVHLYKYKGYNKHHYNNWYFNSYIYLTITYITKLV